MVRTLIVNGRNWLISYLFLACIFQLVVAKDRDFRLLSQEVSFSLSHTIYLGLTPTAMADGKMLFFIRQESPKLPGDYFRPPMGADSVSISDIEISKKDSILQTFINSANFSKLILDSLNGYEYAVAQGTVHRREYHVSYACGDTIYVISGWFGKFLSFYRAIPGDFRYDASDLRQEVAKLMLSYPKIGDNSFRRIDDERNYFLEYVDRENMIRVRNYLITGLDIFGIVATKGTLTYNLIEITKFIDPEVMP